MARYYRRRYTRVVKPKKKWASNLRDIDIKHSTTAGNTNKGGYCQVLCVNSNEVTGSTATAPTPTIIKTGNYKVQCDCLFTATAAESPNMELVLYIMYLPEGVFTDVQIPSMNYTTLKGIVTKHPEWILAWRQFDSGHFLTQNPMNVERVQFSSRLKRNLNSGDSVCAVLLAIVDKDDANITRLECHGVCQFWTCSN